MADTLVLVVSDLVTNALRHGGGHYTLKLSADPDTVTAAVASPGPRLRWTAGSGASEKPTRKPLRTPVVRSGDGGGDGQGVCRTGASIDNGFHCHVVWSWKAAPRSAAGRPAIRTSNLKNADAALRVRHAPAPCRRADSANDAGPPRRTSP